MGRARVAHRFVRRSTAILRSAYATVDSAHVSLKPAHARLDRRDAKDVFRAREIAFPARDRTPMVDTRRFAECDVAFDGHDAAVRSTESRARGTRCRDRKSTRL